FGPMGILFNSETGSRTRQYNKLRGRFMTEHNQKWPTRDEEDALWLQTLEPVLRFDQALEQIKQSEQRIRRPLLVVVLSSLMCVRWSTMTHHRVIAPHVISATADTTPPGPPKLVPDDGGGDFDFVQDGNWMVPVVETEYRHEPWCYQSVMLAAYRPRGPPVPTCQGANPDLCPFSLVLPEEIVT
ncbi:MAG: hypothetical protein KBB55_04005, partial [Candidatus Buchananbacteria bacterium]|nr:hypothetical protein [Candidatus Buchananbacteria bacterium]